MAASRRRQVNLTRSSRMGAPGGSVARSCMTCELEGLGMEDNESRGSIDKWSTAIPW